MTGLGASRIIQWYVGSALPASLLIPVGQAVADKHKFHILKGSIG